MYVRLFPILTIKTNPGIMSQDIDNIKLTFEGKYNYSLFECVD